MKTFEIKQKIDNGYKIIVCVQPNKNYDKMILKTWLKSNNTNIIFSVYHNHCKDFLTELQKEFIALYNEVKNYQFRDKVELNVKSKRNNCDINDIKKLTMLQCITKMEYAEV